MERKEHAMATQRNCKDGAPRKNSSAYEGNGPSDSGSRK